MSELNVQELANTAWAFATVNRLDEKLLTALAGAAEQRVHEFKPQELANGAWVFATANRPGEKLFTAFARAVDWPLDSDRAKCRKFRGISRKFPGIPRILFEIYRNL